VTGTEIALIIAACGTVINAITGAMNLLVSRRGVRVSQINSEKLETVRQLTEKVQEETNGMKAELITEVREASFAKGVKSETDKSHAG
jgi:hypothetical protein